MTTSFLRIKKSTWIKKHPFNFFIMINDQNKGVTENCIFLYEKTRKNKKKSIPTEFPSFFSRFFFVMRIKIWNGKTPAEFHFKFYQSKSIWIEKSKPSLCDMLVIEEKKSSKLINWFHFGVWVRKKCWCCC